MAEGGRCRDERRGSSDSEVGTDDATTTSTTKRTLEKEEKSKRKVRSVLSLCRKRVQSDCFSVKNLKQEGLLAF